jgi:hypothetical protein
METAAEFVPLILVSQIELLMVFGIQSTNGNEFREEILSSTSLLDTIPLNIAVAAK